MDTKAGGNLSKLLGGIPLTLYYNGFDATDNVSACAALLCLSVSRCCMLAQECISLLNCCSTFQIIQFSVQFISVQFHIQIFHYESNN